MVPTVTLSKMTLNFYINSEIIEFTTSELSMLLLFFEYYFVSQ